MKRRLLILTLCLSLFGTIMAQQSTFAPQGAEWYFNVSSFMGSPITYYRMAVEGDTLIQGHRCSVITRPFFGGHGEEQYVYEENRKVYWYNQTLQAFTTLYDFDANEGDTWICEVDSCAFEIQVQSVEEIIWESHSYRVQNVVAIGGSEYYNSFYYVGNGTIIDGIGDIYGLFPYSGACSGSFYDGQYPNYLRCYLEDGDMLFHYGSYDCDEQGYCWDGTIADSYAGGDGTAENPYLISNGKQLALLAYETNIGTGGDAFYKLTANINLEKCSGGYNTWTSIGVPEIETTPRCFTGHFDGGGNYILNLYQLHDATFKGLFGCTNGAEIKDVNLVYCEIGNGSEYAGGLVAYAGSTDISNCSVQNSQITTTGGVAGGIVGYAGMPFGVHETNENVSRITNCKIERVTVESVDDAGGIVGKINDDAYYARYLVSNCGAHNEQYYHVKGSVSGGIVGEMRFGTIKGCANKTTVVGAGQVPNVCAGGIIGSIHSSGVIANSYNRGNVVTDIMFAGGIAGYSAGDIYNVYNTGEIYMPDSTGGGYGNIIGNVQSGERLNCYWFENGLPSAGNPILPEMPGSTSFHEGATPKTWVLNEAQYGTTDLLEALNLGPHDNYLWLEDTNNTNDGYPICVDIEPSLPIFGSEWYYEILNDDGSITYQYLQHSGDTTIQDEPVQIIVKINTLYDKGKHVEKSHEYIYERDDKVYWWNKTLEEFTVLYDYKAQVGDEWEINVGLESLLMHVDAVELYEYEGRQYKMLQVSDAENLFSGTIVCGIGHLTSFFPERLLNKGYRIEGIRCFWQAGELVFKYGEKECDEVYEEFHDYSLGDLHGSEGFYIFPNPTDGMITISGRQTGEYRITNLMGQTLMTGDITTENQQLDISNLPKGIYFITVGKNTRKIVIQ